MMPAAVQDVSHGLGYTQQNDPYSQALMDFFGMPSNQTMVQAYQYFPRTNQTLPDAYEGRNLFLNDTVRRCYHDCCQIKRKKRQDCGWAI